jgi:hypothetical protein
MAEALTTRGIEVTQVEALPEDLPTVDRHLGALVHAELNAHGVKVETSTTIRRIAHASVQGQRGDGSDFTATVDLVLVVVGVKPDVPSPRGPGQSSTLAVGRSRAGPGEVSLSPSSVRDAAVLDRLVLPSPNGSTISYDLARSGAEVLARQKSASSRRPLAAECHQGTTPGVVEELAGRAVVGQVASRDRDRRALFRGADAAGSR